MTAPAGLLTLHALADLGEGIALRAAEAIAQARGGAAGRPQPQRAEARSIRIPEPPLVLRDVAPLVPGVVPAPPTGWRGTLGVALYDFGVAALRWELAWPGDAEWDAVVAEAARLVHRLPAWEWAGPALEALEQVLRPAIIEPERGAAREEYAILRLHAEPAGGITERDLTRLLLDEARPLAPAAREALLGRDFRYTPADRVVVAYDAALVVEPDPADADVEFLLEFANAQLLELQVYERLLDARLPQLEAGATRAPGLRAGRRMQRLLSEIHLVAATTARLVERADNALRITDDIWLARVYRAALEVMNEPAWRREVEKKLQLARSTAESLNDLAAAARSEFLEAVIIALIGFEILLTLLGR